MSFLNDRMSLSILSPVNSLATSAKRFTKPAKLCFSSTVGSMTSSSVTSLNGVHSSSYARIVGVVLSSKAMRLRMCRPWSPLDR